MFSIQNFFKKELKKFRKKAWYSKALDIFTVVLIILVLIPATRKELMTYASKIKMHLTSVEKEEIAVGQKEKNSFILKSSSGAKSSLNEHLDKPVFINFWATWCPPCRAEMPAIQKLYNKYNESVNFLIVSNQDMATQQDFLKKNDYKLPVYQLTSKPEGAFSYSVLPTTYMISNEQKIIFEKEGAHNWNSKKIHAIFDEMIE
ncbi:MAG: TlpA family protein disulfide reductase [Bacteroidota bacterium]